MQTRRPNMKSGYCTFSSESGMALVMVMILSVIALAVVTGLLYMLTSATQISGMQKRYKSALEAGIGGSEVMFQLIGSRGNPFGAATTAALNLSFPAADVKGVDCLTAKLNSTAGSWNAACSQSFTINPLDNSTYDMALRLGTMPQYAVYAKIADTVEGNSGGEPGLMKSGVVSNSGEIAVMSVPYLYTLEVHAQNASNPSERAKLSVLYQY